MFSFSATNQKSEDNKRPLLTFITCRGKKRFSKEYILLQNLRSKRQRKESSHDDQTSTNIRRTHQKTSKQEVMIKDISESSLTSTELFKDTDKTLEKFIIKRFENELKSQRLIDDLQKKVHSQVSIVEETNDKQTFSEKVHKYRVAITEPWNKSASKPFRSPTTGENKQSKHLFSRDETAEHIPLRKFKDELHVNLQTDKQRDKLLRHVLSRQESTRHEHVHNVKDELHNQGTDHEPRNEMDGKPSSPCTNSRKEHFQDVFPKHETVRHVLMSNKHPHKHEDTIRELEQEINTTPSVFSTRKRNETCNEVLFRSKLKEKRCGNQDTVKPSGALKTSVSEPVQDTFFRQGTPRQVDLRKSKKDRYKDTITELRKDIDITPSSSPTRSKNKLFSHDLSSHALLCNFKDELHTLKTEHKCQNTVTQSPKEMDRTPFSSAICIRNELSRHEYSISVSCRHTPSSKFSRTEMLHEYVGKVTESPTGIAEIPPNFSTKIKKEPCKGVFPKSRLPDHVSLREINKEKYVVSHSQSTVTKSTNKYSKQVQLRTEIDGTPSSTRTQSKNAFSRLGSPIHVSLCKLDRDASRISQNIYLDAQNKMYEIQSYSPASSKNELSEYDSLKYQSLRKFKDELHKHHYTVSEPQNEMNETSFICLTRCENKLSMHKSPMCESMCKLKDVLSNQGTNIQPQKKMYTTLSTSPTRRKIDSRRDWLLCKFKDKLSKYHDIDHEPQKEMNETPSSCHTRNENELSGRDSPIRVLLYKFKDYLLKYRNQVLEAQKQINGTPYSSLAKSTNILSKHALSTHETQSNASTQHVPLSLKGMAETASNSSIKIRKVPFRRDFQRKLNFPSRHVPIRKSKNDLCTYRNIVPHPRKELHRTPFNSLEKIKHVVSRYDPSKYILSKSLYSRKRKNKPLKYQSTVTQQRKKLIRTSSKSPVTAEKMNSKPRCVLFQIIHKKSEDASNTASDTSQTTRTNHSTLSILNDGNIKMIENQEKNKGYFNFI